MRNKSHYTENNDKRPARQRPKRRQLTLLDYFLYLVIVILLAIGVWLLLKPQIDNQQRQAISDDLVEILKNPPQVEASRGIWVNRDANRIPGESYDSQPPDNETNPTNRSEMIFIEPIAIIQIDKINLANLPIMRGATNENLRYGAALYTGTGSVEISEPGQSTIFGHHMWEYGRHFNRLEELEIGDTVRIIYQGKEYLYVIDKTIAVTPNKQIENIRKPRDENSILLITCKDPPDYPLRFLVFAKLESIREQ